MASTPNLLKASEITVKATLNDEIRRFKFNRTKGFNGLVEELKTFFGLNSTDFVVQYKDDEGDNITMGSDSELSEAVALSKNGILNLLLVSGSSSSSSLQPQKLSMEESFYHIETSQSFTNIVRSDAHSQSPVASASPAAAPASPASPSLPLPVVPNAYTQFVPTPYHKKPQQPQPIPPQPHQQPYPYYPHYAHPFPQQPYMPPFTPPPILMTPSPSANFYTNVHQQRIKLQEWREEQENAVKQWKAHEKQVRKQEKQERKQAKATAKLQKPPPLIARFVKDVTIQDGMHFPPNTPFTKTWRLRNESSVAWPDGAVELVFDGKGSDQMNGDRKSVV